LDKYVPLVGNTIINTRNSISFTITNVDLPTMASNGGMVVDINNVSNGYYKTASQIITLRTLIGL